MQPKILLSVREGNQTFYVDAVNGTGGIPVAEYCPEVDLRYDGLILCGGSDVHPKFYNEEIDGAIGIDLARDEAELRLADVFIRAGKPVLGVCRGCQVLNVYFGGTLIQDIPGGWDVHHKEVDKVHPVTAVAGSLLHKLYGSRFSVNSMHHQSVKTLGKGLKVTMTSETVPVVECIEHESLPVFGVQWHPERMCFQKRREDTVDGAAVFAYFVDLCRKGADTQSDSAK